VIAVFFSVICIAVATSKRRNPWLWGILGFLFSFIALIVVAVLPSGRSSELGAVSSAAGGVRQCPQCGANQGEGTFCTSCGSRLPTEAVVAARGFTPGRFITPLVGLLVGLMFSLILLQVTKLSAETFLGQALSQSEFEAVQEMLGGGQPVVLFWPVTPGLESLWTRGSATSLAWGRLPATLEVMILGGGLAVLLAWGLALRLRRQRRGNSAGRMVIASLSAMPVFWLGLLILLVLIHVFDWLPPFRYQDFWDGPKDNILQLIWPIFTIGLVGGLWTALQMRSSEDTSPEVTLARALGLVLRHGGMLLSGVILLEILFAVPGLGRMLLQSVLQRDPAVLGVAAAIIIWIALLSRFFGNLLLAAVDGDPPARTEAIGGTESVPVLAIGSAVILGLLVLLLLMPILAPEDPQVGSLQERLTGPSTGHFFGTDRLGRDIFSRVLHGGRTAALIGLPMGLLALFIGFPMVIARVMLDRARMPELVSGIEGVLEGLVAVPWLVVGILVQTNLGPGWPFLALAIILIPRALRVGWELGAGERLQVMDLASVALRLGALFLAASLAMSTALGFFGVGVALPRADLGGMLAESREVIQVIPWAIVFPGLGLTLIGSVWLAVATLFSRKGPENRPVGWAHPMS